MSANSPSWYIPGDGKQPAGPFTAEQVVQLWKDGRLRADAVCWREGMPQWLPLSQVEPFASAIRSASPSKHPAPLALPTTHAALAAAWDRCVARVRNAVAADKRIIPLAAGIAVAVILLLAVWFFALTGGYQLDCKLGSDEYGNVCIDAAVKGKAAKVALVLVDPHGKSDVLVIEENDMITNRAERRLRIEPEAGTYILTLKTFTPERVVCTRKITLSPREFDVEVEDVSVGIVPCAGVDRDYLGKELDISGVKIFVRKRGTLPLRFKSVSLSADGQAVMASLKKPVVGAGRHVVEVAASTWAQRVILRRGARCVVEGQLFYGKDGKSSLPFRKEFVLE